MVPLLLLCLFCVTFCLTCCKCWCDRTMQAMLSQAFKVEGIPTLVLADPKTGECQAPALKVLIDFF